MTTLHDLLEEAADWIAAERGGQARCRRHGERRSP
jgi:hypothetical protein